MPNRNKFAKIQKKELPNATITDWDKMSNLYRKPSIDASFIDSFSQAVSEEKIQM